MRLAVSVADLSKDYVLSGETIHALRGVSFDVPEGDYISIMGPSGSGKSTLLNLLGCLDRPSGGRYMLSDTDVSQMPDDEARTELCRLPGVGEKVANCTLLFGFGRLRAFPIDVWIERVLRQIYFPRKRKVTSRRLREFSSKYFGSYGGYAQQYLFHHARMTWRRRPASDQ